MQHRTGKRFADGDKRSVRLGRKLFSLSVVRPSLGTLLPSLLLFFLSLVHESRFTDRFLPEATTPLDSLPSFPSPPHPFPSPRFLSLSFTQTGLWCALTA